jgi:hypothetical protein
LYVAPRSAFPGCVVESAFCVEDTVNLIIRYCSASFRGHINIINMRFVD